MADDFASQLQGTVSSAIRVLTDPRGFFSSLPKEGGYEGPGIFAAVMLIAQGILLALLSLLHIGPGSFFASLLLTPVFGAIGLAVGAAIVMFASRAVGGEATFESSFRIVAYAAAIAPIHAVASIVPYLPILVNAYGLYIAIIALIAVNRVPEQKAWSVFGAVAGVLLLLSLLATISARRAARRLERWEHHLEKSAEELGKASEQWQKQMEKATEQLKRQMENQNKGQ